ncbi:MAG TPA: hypothetical protein VMR70_00665 [Flavisolibacter sp.]|nr:hypothetical protein [Flavisolibacter sp.]
MRLLFSISTACYATLFLSSCQPKNETSPALLLKDLNLKRGEVISCSPSGKEFGSLSFEITGKDTVKKTFELGVKLLHSFEYDEAEKIFANVLEHDPQCAMAYWGVGMSNFHALWSPPTKEELAKGAKAIQIAQSITNKTDREKDYISALAAFYNGHEKVDHRTRCLRFENAMKMVKEKYPADKDATVFYALSLIAAADPADKSFTKQKQAGALLQALYAGQPDHPGVVHYLIHAYDSPELAHLGLNAARVYASVAPSSAHALHMPSHIFTRLGLWDECIKSNLASVKSAQCYAQSTGIKGHWDEELHGLDYLVYAYLQNGQKDSAKKWLDYLTSIKKITPANFKVAYAVTAIPSRFLLENRLWSDAVNLQLQQTNLDWKKFPWQKAIFHFTRLMGAVHTNQPAVANKEYLEMQRLHAILLEEKDVYKAAQVEVQLKAAEAWMLWKKKKDTNAIALMKTAADLEDRTEKHPVTPAEILPARELLGDLCMEAGKPGEALIAYKQNLKKHPNRLNGLTGAATAAEKAGRVEESKMYRGMLAKFTQEEKVLQPKMKESTARR